MKYYGNSIIGKMRKENEDSYVLKELSQECLLAVVADGMGGYSGGKKASETAVKAIVDYVQDRYEKFGRFSERSFRKLLFDSVNEANKCVYELSKGENLLNGMGTTLVICIVRKNNYYVANVGDSRMYLFDKSLRQITKDHSYVNELVELGLISEEDARVHPNKNVITRAVGTEKKVESDFFTGILPEGSKILMCSDGLSNMMKFDEIAKTLEKSENVEATVEELIEMANTNGGKDNITAILITNECEGGEK